jgi:hypothetical protein
MIKRTMNKPSLDPFLSWEFQDPRISDPFRHGTGLLSWSACQQRVLTKFLAVPFLELLH